MKSMMDDNVILYKQKLSYRTDAPPNQCLSQPWFVRLAKPVYYPRYGCSIEPLICGENVFGKIAEDLKAAVHSVDIITWGFDPGMILVRDGLPGSNQRYGDLLIEIATRAEKPVTVRLLIWHDDLASQLLMNNAPGYYGPSLPPIGSSKGTGFYNEHHQAYSKSWYEKIIRNKIPKIHLHVRHVPRSLLETSIAGEILPKELNVVGVAAALYAAHHQKMILIDFERPKVAVGYVMGHNSMTEYWDCAEHKFQDARRERVYHMDHVELQKRAWREGPSFEGAPGCSPPEHLIKEKKRAVQAYIDRHSHIVTPYQDVSCRVRGPILHDLNHNFCEGWSESARPSSAFLDTLWLIPIPPVQIARKVAHWYDDALNQEDDSGFIARRNKIPIGAFPRQKSEHAAQLVRTQPLHEEKGAKECFANLTRQMGHYIFLQNQYMQYAPWSEHLRSCVHNLRAAGYTEPIYVFLLTSTPERAGMDRPTHELVGRVGQGQSMPVAQKEEVENAMKTGTMPPISEVEMVRSGINVVMCSMWNWAATGGKLLPHNYEEIYIHSKVMIVDDAALTIGSANLNLRSMALDSELNVLSNASEVAYKLRTELFLQSTGRSGPEKFGSMKLTFNEWVSMQSDNKSRMKNGMTLRSNLMPFYVDRKPTSSLI
jgi:phosphatidylserine/phosphatidylglycerophosphate/cardiolipin synthase-like enzyme